MVLEGERHVGQLFVTNENRKSLQRTMSSNKPIDIDPEPPSGLKCLANAVFLQATNVPEEVWSRLPSEAVTVSNLLGTNLPDRLPKTLITKPVHQCVSPLDPCWTIDQLFKTSVPSRPWLYILEEGLSTLWASGTRSIRPPSSQGSDLRFPLWVMNFWNVVEEIVKQRVLWRKAEDWLAKRRVQDPELREARRLFDRVPWGLRLWSLVTHDRVTRIGHLAGLLSNEWLGERHISIISSYLCFLARRERRTGPTTLVADPDLHIYLSSNSKATAEKIQAHTGLRAYTERILDNGYSRLFIPARIGGNHWIVFSVDFDKQTFEYGEFT